MKTPRNYTEDRNRRHSLTRRAHKSEETGGPRQMHPVDKIRGHKVSVSEEDKDDRLTCGAGRP